METWDELDNEENSENDEQQANLTLMALTSSEAESDSDSGSNSEEEDEVFSNLSRYDIITFLQDLMCRCQERSRHMKILKKQYDLLKDEIKSFERKHEALEKEHIALV